MMLYTTVINGVFAVLIAAALVMTRNGVTDIFLLNLLFYIIITPVISLTMTKMMFMSENGMIVADALKRVDTILDAAPLFNNAAGTVPTDASIQLQHVSYSYDGKRNALDDVSLTIPSGKTAAFVGSSGSGKTTAANLISRFFDTQKGAVLIGGVNVKEIPKEQLMETISFVFQNSRLIKGTILDNIKMGKPDATEQEVRAALEQAQCMDILEKLPNGLQTVIGTGGIYLSGGEQQRIAIARTILKNAPILIFDEATAFADPDNEAKVQAAISALAKDKTILIIAHRLSTITHADYIFVLEEGKLIESGTAEELQRKNGVFQKMWDAYQTSVQWKVSKEGQTL